MRKGRDQAPCVRRSRPACLTGMRQHPESEVPPLGREHAQYRRCAFSSQSEKKDCQFVSGKRLLLSDCASCSGTVNDSGADGKGGCHLVFRKPCCSCAPCLQVSLLAVSHHPLPSIPSKPPANQMHWSCAGFNIIPPPPPPQGPTSHAHAPTPLPLTRRHATVPFTLPFPLPPCPLSRAADPSSDHGMVWQRRAAGDCTPGLSCHIQSQKRKRRSTSIRLQPCLDPKL